MILISGCNIGYYQVFKIKVNPIILFMSLDMAISISDKLKIYGRHLTKKY